MTRTLVYSFAFLVAVFFSAMVILALFFTSEIDDWLTVSDTVEAQVLIVEGWTAPGTAGEAAMEFSRGNYDYLITTGGPLDEVYNMSQNGRIRFDLNAAGIDWSAGDTVSVSLYAFGEPAAGEYARYTIIHREDTIGRDYTTARMQRYEHNYIVGGDPAGVVYVAFDNDFVTDDEDRNLHLWKLETGGITIPVRSDHTWLLRRSGSGIRDRPLHQRTLAEEKAFQLIRSGVDSSRIVVLEVPRVRRLRTYTDAVIVNEWFREKGGIPPAVNVFSQGNHARRSRVLYNSALPDSVRVGIIASGSRPRSGFVFYDLDIGPLRELGAYVYTRIFFNPGRQYRRIIRKISSGDNK
jgi:hypothetical protein